MNTDPTCAPTLSVVRRALVLAGGTVLLATSCNTTPAYGPDGNVFVQPRYGYGSPQQGNNTGRPAATADRTGNKPTTNRKTPDITRDPSDTTVDVTPPEPKEKKEPAADSTPTDTTSTPSDTVEKEKTADTTESKPAAPREDLPFGQPVVGKKGYVYSPYAPDKGQVDVDGIPAGTKVKCPYTGKTFRVP